MIDIIESMENAAERRFDEMTKGLSEGKFRCRCGNVEDLYNANTATANPYSEPICSKCLEQILKEQLP